MKQSSSILKKINSEYLNFLKKFRSLHLSSIGENGHPVCSYAPFVKDDKRQFYIYVSNLAAHTKNLMIDGRAGIMFIEPEEQAENIFARKRVTFECVVELVPRDTEDWQKIMTLFDQLDGELMQTLRSLSDFQLIRLIPLSGRFVKGFGKAYHISGAGMDQLSHINPGR
jgi:putative heme iron utilization protein